MPRRTPSATLFPYTTLFRSKATRDGVAVVMTTQTLQGRVGLRVYDTGRDLLKAGVLEGQEIPAGIVDAERSEEHTSELQSRVELVCRLLLEKKNKKRTTKHY